LVTDKVKDEPCARVIGRNPTARPGVHTTGLAGK